MSIELHERGFEYRVSVNITITATDLRLIKRASEMHYDYNCRKFFSDTEPAPGNYWRNKFVTTNADGELDYDVDPLDEAIPGDLVSDPIRVSFDDVDRVSKILEMGHYAETDINAGHSISLRLQFKKVILAIQDEHLRLQPDEGNRSLTF